MPSAKKWFFFSKNTLVLMLSDEGGWTRPGVLVILLGYLFLIEFMAEMIKSNVWIYYLLSVDHLLFNTFSFLLQKIWRNVFFFLMFVHELCYFCFFSLGVLLRILETHTVVTVDVSLHAGDRQNVPKQPGFRWLCHQEGKHLRRVLLPQTCMRSWVTAAREWNLIWHTHMMHYIYLYIIYI